MKQIKTILVGGLAIFLTGCVLRGTPKIAKITPPPPDAVVVPPPDPPRVLSTPQTSVQLPSSQPLDPEALLTLPPPPGPVPDPTPPRRPRRNPTVVATPAPPKPETASPATEPVVEERPAIQEIIPAAEQQRLRESVERRVTETNQILDQFKKRVTTSQQKTKIGIIKSLLDVTSDAVSHSDLKQADENAEKAQVLAQGLLSGK